MFHRNTLRLDTSCLSKHASSEEWNSIQKCQEKLEKQIHAFHNRLSLLGEGLQQINVTTDPTNEDGKQSDSHCNDSDVDNEEPGKILPEMVVIQLPSSFGPAVLETMGLSEIMKQELELQKGQANDILEELRLLLGHKALLFRTEVSQIWAIESTNSQGERSDILMGVRTQHGPGGIYENLRLRSRQRLKHTDNAGMQWNS